MSNKSIDRSSDSLYTDDESVVSEPATQSSSPLDLTIIRLSNLFSANYLRVSVGTLRSMLVDGLIRRGLFWPLGIYTKRGHSANRR